MKKGQKVRLNDNTIATIADSTFFVMNGEEIKITITGSPENLKEHKGVHMRVMSCFIESLKTKF